MITNAAPSKALLGNTNGLAQTAASLMRAIGPASITALFAVSVEKNLLGGWLIYVIMVALTLSSVGFSLLLDDRPQGDI